MRKLLIQACVFSIPPIIVDILLVEFKSDETKFFVMFALFAIFLHSFRIWLKEDL